MKLNLFQKPAFCLLTLLALAAVTFGVGGSEDEVWTPVANGQLRSAGFDLALPNAYAAFRLSRPGLNAVLNKAPEEFGGGDGIVLKLPMPDGSLSRFRIVHSLIVEPGLLVKFPELGATYRGQGIDDPTATVRFDVMPSGFHAVILSPNGTVYVAPYEGAESSDYISFNHNDAPSEWFDFECTANDADGLGEAAFGAFSSGASSPSVVSGTALRTYRLAAGATGEYAQAYGGGTVAGSLAALTTTMNFVNAIYEREAAIRLVLVANNASVVFTDPVADGYTHDNLNSLLAENQVKLDTIIGTSNYDIGHVFDGRILAGGFSYSGQASIASACSPAAKARGVDVFRSVAPGNVIAYYNTAHEFGHQFGATHTMNGTTPGCGTQRTGFSAYEPGSGSTIMGYRWNCGGQDLRSSDTYFHNASLEQIVNYTTTGLGTCVTPAATDNLPPTVNAGPNFTIPKLTPFALTATGGDPDGDPVTYTWEETDTGPASPPDTDADGVARPILRSYAGTTNPSRTFPSLSYVLANANVPPATHPCPIGGGTCLLGESLPSISRTMNFRVTARDTRAIGGVNSSAMQINVDGGSGPFTLVSPNTNLSYSGNSTQTITWNVANTNVAPVSATAVNILYSSDGGSTFPTVLASGSPNDGSEAVRIPIGDTTAGRIKIEAAGNVFFDISDSNFTVAGVTFSGAVPFDYDGDRKSDISIYRPSVGDWYAQRSRDGLFGVRFGLPTDKIAPADYDGDAKTDIALYRPSDNTWYIVKSSDGTFSFHVFGLADDMPVPGDFDGDGRADISVFRPSDSTWYRLNSRDGSFFGRQFGAAGDRPVMGDFDGDAKADLALFRPSIGVWYQIRSADGAFFGEQFGASSDRIVPADYDGDGKTDLAVYRPSNGFWYIKQSQSSAFTQSQFGSPADIPAPGDFDGDGEADISVFRPSDGNWYRTNSANSTFFAFPFGTSGDRPTQSAYQ